MGRVTGEARKDNKDARQLEQEQQGKKRVLRRRPLALRRTFRIRPTQSSNASAGRTSRQAGKI
jgi:hypothetical protein